TMQFHCHAVVASEVSYRVSWNPEASPVLRRLWPQHPRERFRCCSLPGEHVVEIGRQDELEGNGAQPGKAFLHLTRDGLDGHVSTQPHDELVSAQSMVEDLRCLLEPGTLRFVQCR